MFITTEYNFHLGSEYKSDPRSEAIFLCILFCVCPTPSNSSFSLYPGLLWDKFCSLFRKFYRKEQLPEGHYFAYASSKTSLKYMYYVQGVVFTY